MTIKRLRPCWTPADLNKLYSRPYDHTKWLDHIHRVNVTIEKAQSFVKNSDKTGADLSCGDGAILGAMPLKTKYFGDLTPGWPICGPIEDTIYKIPKVDFFILSETLEHVDRPLELLKAIRVKTKKLVLTTPHGEWDNGNPEHYWGWDEQGIADLLAQAHFVAKETHFFRYSPTIGYEHQLWLCV